MLRAPCPISIGDMTTLSAVSIITAHMSRALDFYTKLGLTVDSGGPNEDHSELTSPGIRVLLDTEDIARAIDPGWIRPTGGPALSLAFECDSPAEVDATFAALTSDGAGTVHAPWDAFWGQRYAVIADPDGNPVDLFATL